MKKLLAIISALAMVMSPGAAASAAESPQPGEVRLFDREIYRLINEQAIEAYLTEVIRIYEERGYGTPESFAIFREYSVPAVWKFVTVTAPGFSARGGTLRYEVKELPDFSGDPDAPSPDGFQIRPDGEPGNYGMFFVSVADGDGSWIDPDYLAMANGPGIYEEDYAFGRVVLGDPSDLPEDMAHAVLFWCDQPGVTNTQTLKFYKSDTPYTEGITLYAENSDKTLYTAAITQEAVSVSPGEQALQKLLASGAIISTTPLAEAPDDLTTGFGGDSVKPGETLYYRIPAPYDDEDLFEIKVNRGKGSKNVQSAKVEREKLTLYDFNGVLANDGERLTLIKVKLKDRFTDEETKITFDVKLEAKADGNGFMAGTKLEVRDFSKIWMRNATDEGDQTYRAGTGGAVVKPVKNEDNEVEWENDGGTIARLSFTADSDVTKYFPKLSTKWPEGLYDALAGDRDAYYLSFVGNPRISSTARATLDLTVPFAEEGGLTVEKGDILLYELAEDGTLTDVTSQGRLLQNDDGDWVFRLRTRGLGTYLFAAEPLVPAPDEH